MIVNGKKIQIQELDSRTIQFLLKKFEINNKMVAIEINGEILPKEKWDEYELKDTDRIEIIRMVGGG